MTTHMGSYNILPIFMQMARGWSPFDAGLVLFCRPLGGFLISMIISRLMKREDVALHWVIRLCSFCMGLAFTILYFLAHRVSDPARLRPLIIGVLLLQAGGSMGTQIPAQAILVARMSAERLASIQRSVPSSTLDKLARARLTLRCAA